MSLDIENKQWYVLYTKSRNEKIAESELLKKGIEAFSPRISIERKWSDRVKIIEEPLFKSYCFAKFSVLNDKFRVLNSQGITHIVHFEHQYIPIDQETIDSIKILLENDLQVDPYPYLKEGKEIRIKKGPLKGFKGFIEEKRQNNMSLIVTIEAIGASIRCQVDADVVDLA